MAVEVGVKLFDQADRRQVLAQREAPRGQAAGFVELDGRRRHGRGAEQRSGEMATLPRVCTWCARQNAAGVTSTPLRETKLLIQVNLQGTYNVFPLGKLCLYLGTPAFREFASAGYGGKLFSCHRAAYSGGKRADTSAHLRYSVSD
jgi:hypothetical protein